MLSKCRWWRDAVIYQVYVRSFLDSTGDGIGDLAGVRAGLPYLKKLGVDGIWLSPFYPSPQHDHGYDVADYCGVDPLCGDLAEFDLLMAAARRLGVKVLLDIVPKDAPGLSFGALENKMGWHMQSTRQVILTDCRVPAGNLLAAEGEGFRIAMAGLDGGRLNIAACSLGGAQGAFDKALAYTAERKRGLASRRSEADER